jgi:hypothetical protein
VVHRAGGWGPIIAVITGAILTVAVTFALAPRIKDRNRRFFVLGTVVYLMAGLVSVTVGNAHIIGVSIGDMVSDPVTYLWQLLAWPLFLMVYLSGGYGR